MGRLGAPMKSWWAARGTGKHPAFRDETFSLVTDPPSWAETTHTRSYGKDTYQKLPGWITVWCGLLVAKYRDK